MTHRLAQKKQQGVTLAAAWPLGALRARRLAEMLSNHEMHAFTLMHRGAAMAILTVRNLPEEVHRPVRARDAHPPRTVSFE